MKVTIVFVEGVYRVIADCYNWSDFPTFEMAAQFCRDMGYETVPLNSKRGIRILNPTDPRSI